MPERHSFKLSCPIAHITPASKWANAFSLAKCTFLLPRHLLARRHCHRILQPFGRNFGDATAGRGVGSAGGFSGKNFLRERYFPSPPVPLPPPPRYTFEVFNEWKFSGNVIKALLWENFPSPLISQIKIATLSQMS